jgi:hypothetical protein
MFMLSEASKGRVRNWVTFWRMGAFWVRAEAVWEATGVRTAAATATTARVEAKAARARVKSERLGRAIRIKNRPPSIISYGVTRFCKAASIGERRS